MKVLEYFMRVLEFFSLFLTVLIRSIESEVVSAEGKDLVVVNVPEVMREMKPVRVIKTGQAYIRMYDGDYPLSQMEDWTRSTSPARSQS